MTSLKSSLLIVAALILAAAPFNASAQYVTQPVPEHEALGTGPYKAVMEPAPGLPTHTLYRPAHLRAVRGKLPIIAWGEGACANEGNRFRFFLSELSSHGYLILAVGPIGSPDKEIWRQNAPQPQAGALPAKLPPPATHSSQLIDAINWAIAENARAGSPFFHRLDTSKIAVMGMSCGGAQAIEVSPDPRVTTTVMWNSGLFPGETTMGGGKTLTKDDLHLIHASIAYISGDESDVAFANANDDFERLNQVPAFRAYRKHTGHGGTYGEVNGGDFGKVGAAWLAWRLKGDAKAGQMFLGPHCGLCTDPQWVVRQKNLD
jgi:dienelactone hydrolase